MRGSNDVVWPSLRYADWAETCSTLHLWTQVVGKIRLAQTPWLNHSWHVPLYLTSRGLTTSPIPHGTRSFEIAFDFTRHVLDVAVSDGSSRQLALTPQPVARFHRDLLDALAQLGVPVAIDDRPCEIPGAIALSADHVHASYVAEDAHRFWRVLAQADRIFKRFRTGFIGKASPVHFFWGSFDLAVTRFSGERAPLFQGSVPGLSLDVMQEAYSHEVSSAGFWPGNANVDASFYSYAYPTPAGFRHAAVQPQGAHFHEALGEFLLPYEIVRGEEDPEAAVMQFLQSTYEAAATLLEWDRTALERGLGVPGRVPDFKG
jgi:hypothetical protein